MTLRLAARLGALAQGELLPFASFAASFDAFVAFVRLRKKKSSFVPFVSIVGAALLTAACERESRPVRDLPVAAARAQSETQTVLQAGSPLPPPATFSPYQENAWGQAEGKRLFTIYNCAGCHANGGGGIGPPLMDDEWIYGFDPANIYSTIIEGRPNGMPSFRNKIPDQQVWQLVAYIQALSAQTPIDSSPGRSDHMRAHTSETITPYGGRVQTGHK